MGNAAAVEGGINTRIQRLYVFSDKDKMALEKTFHAMGPDEHGFVTKQVVLDNVPVELTLSPLCRPALDVIVNRRIKKLGARDADYANKVTEHDYLMFLSLFSAREVAARKIEVMFEVFDGNGDGFVDKDELIVMWKRLQGAAFTDDQYLARAEAVMAQADADADGRLSIREFASMVSGSDVLAYMTAFA
uniref:EF-hand domain-containing protein n=1 Tax=Bicosoecida sp. CB-2014 TaxID=1486930 RepID=A0A7S1CJD2_9STRA|mmetsp:Transcript_26068/g.90736  ORF Transcript_26068/g.90736 Transcript_26068/m.90736 type:complete len:190 (+) Transcript_26068:162-731(+)